MANLIMSAWRNHLACCISVAEMRQTGKESSGVDASEVFTLLIRQRAAISFTLHLIEGLLSG